MPLDGRAVITYSLDVMLADRRCRSVWIVTKEEEWTTFQDIVQKIFPNQSKSICWVTGGKERQDSVRLALDQLTEKGDALVLIHDAARPFLSREIIDRLLSALDQADAVVPAIQAKDFFESSQSIPNGHPVA
ncbi:2-C-methyl-D-erythritol 4-phosphate cytidylyltransferase [Alkalibacterium sp. AK22]|nr:2-C-methyl-D-erythritol 4-phosphate cytidylyltransferase [Alkalibacterium sp. AK22]